MCICFSTCVFTRKMKSGLLLLRETGDRLSEVDASSELCEDGCRKVWPVSLVSYNCSSKSAQAHAHIQRHTHTARAREPTNSRKKKEEAYISVNILQHKTHTRTESTYSLTSSTRHFICMAKSRDLVRLLLCIPLQFPFCDSYSATCAQETSLCFPELRRFLSFSFMLSPQLSALFSPFLAFAGLSFLLDISLFLPVWQRRRLSLRSL